MKYIAIIAAAIVVVVGGFLAAQYFAVFEDNALEPGQVVEVIPSQPSQLGTEEAKSFREEGTVDDEVIQEPIEEPAVEPAEPEYGIEEVARGLDVPWSVVFTSSTRMLVSERSGTVRVIENGELVEEPIHTFADVSSQDEEGLMGLALHPDYQQNRQLYACYAYPKNSGLVDKVVMLEDTGTELTNEQVILDDIPAARFHAGCRLGIGPDQKLYITTGDATDKTIAQDVGSLGGKILRLNLDGSIPDDNPFDGSAVYSYGHRNPQGIDWHPESGALLSTEHGPSIFDGPAGGDEVNRIVAGANFGWPVVSHDDSAEGMVDSLIQYTPAIAPGSAMVYGGSVFAAWQGDLFIGALKGEGIVRVSFTDLEAREVSEYELLDIDVGRVRDVVEGPDGLIYFTTSNRDGRGDLREGDDKVYRIVQE